MTAIFSMETRWLRADHAQAVRELKDHQMFCLKCQRAKRRGRPDERCAEGTMIREAEKALSAQAREATRLDRLPNPDQNALWGMEELAGDAPNYQPDEDPPEGWEGHADA